jgi:hypothetical protein
MLCNKAQILCSQIAPASGGGREQYEIEVTYRKVVKTSCGLENGPLPVIHIKGLDHWRVFDEM